MGLLSAGTYTTRIFTPEIIHKGVGYRLLIQLPDGAEAMAQATALMDGFLASFAFTD